LRQNGRPTPPLVRNWSCGNSPRLRRRCAPKTLIQPLASSDPRGRCPAAACIWKLDK
jgi:hypothetical protein